MTLKAKFSNIHNSVPLPLKMVILTIIAGLSVWFALDYIQTKKLRSIHYAELTEKLYNEAMENRLGFNRYVKNLQDTTRLFVTQKKFSDYIEKQEWAVTDNVHVKYTGRFPTWFPDRSVIRTFTPPRHALLLDSGGRVREVYNSHNEPIPPSLLDPAQIMIQKSHDQIFMTSLDEIPYVISSEPYVDPKGELLATLILASPIDNEFIHAALINSSKEYLVALLTAGEHPRVLTSSNLGKLPIGASITTLQENYLIAGKEFFDYGASEIQIKLANFISLANIDKMTNKAILASRQERAMTAFTLIIVFTLIMYWITRHITNISKRINHFSQHTLGMKTKSLKKGDQLYVLKEGFRELTHEIIEARETIKKQAEEKTRLIVNGAFDAIVTTDDKGIISTWNPTACELFGWTSEEALGKPIFDIIIPPELHKEDRNTIRNIINENKDKDHKCQAVIKAYHRNGRKMDIEFSISSANEENDPVLIFIMRDTTERSRSEYRIHHLLMTLRKSKDEWEKTFDTVTEQILLIDRDLNIIRCNKSFAKSIKSSHHEVIGKKFYEFMLCEETWISAIKERKELPERIEIKTYDGHWLYISVMPVYDKQKLFLYTIITATDITELKRTQENLINSKQDLDERINELENFYDMAVNRELKMVKLKKQVQKLETKNGDVVNVPKAQVGPNNAEILNRKTPEQINKPTYSSLDDISAKR